MAYEYMGVTDIANVTQSLIQSLVQNQLKESMRLAPTVLDYSSLAVPGASGFSIPRGSALSAADKSEATDVVASHFTYAADAVTYSHKYVSVDVEDIAKFEAKIALVEDLTGRMGVALADAMDTLINTQLLLASSSAPDHQVKYNDATNEDLQLNDITGAKKLLEIQKVEKMDRYLLICPSQENNLLQIADFVNVDKYGSREAILNGEIGRIFGFRVIVHNENESATQSIFYHKSHACFGMAQDVKIEVWRNGKNLSDLITASFLGGAKVLDAGKRGVVLTVTA